jgi:hypothetical protein
VTGELTSELTFADIAARLGVAWPATDPDDEPRHLLVEPRPGDLATFWAEALTPRAYVQPVADDEPGGT